MPVFCIHNNHCGCPNFCHLMVVLQGKGEMEKGGKIYRAHVVVLPYHGQGHINPMVQFSKRLSSKGIKVTVATTLSITKVAMEAVADGDDITFESIYNDCSEGGVGGPGGFKGFLDRFEASGYHSLTGLIKELQQNNEYPAVKCLVYDANIPWASKIPKQLSIAGAAFFTQSCAAVASYYPMLYDYDNKFSLPVPAFSVPGLPPPQIPSLPSLGSSSDSRYPPIIMHILSQFNGIENADWVLFNSFHPLEEEVVKWMSKLWAVRTIGPTLPSFYLDKRVEDDNAYGFDLYEINTDTCLAWLNSKEKGSVVYVSFGSTAAGLSLKQMTEMAEALIQLHDNIYFLWVVKPSEESKLPSNFIEETKKNNKGLVVRWCAQLEVLSHPGVGCFVTHCGWNSIMEAISFGVPMVAMPQFLDQITNAYFVEQVWQVGVRPKMLLGDDGEHNGGGGVATALEIQRCIEDLVMPRGGEEDNNKNMMMMMKKNAICWKNLAAKAIGEGGTSDMNINQIIEHIIAT